MTNPRLTRRTLLGGAVVAGAALTGCSTVTRSTDVVALNQPVQLPTFTAFGGPRPDLPQTHPLMPQTFFRFPGTPTPGSRRPPGDGTVVVGTTQTSNPIPPTADRNEYWQQLNHRLGVPLQLNITSVGDYSSKFATSVAGDTLGDVFNVDGGFPYLPQFLEARAQDLTEYLSGDAIGDYPHLANIPAECWQGCVYAGGIRAIPIPRGVLSTNLLLTRQDLLADLGIALDSPDLDELLAVAREVTDERHNRWAFGTVPGGTLDAALGVPNGWQLRDGALIAAREVPQYEEKLSLMAKLVSDGLIHADGVTKANKKVWFSNGSALMIEDTYSSIQPFYNRNAGTPFSIGLPVLRAGDDVASLALGQPINSRAAIRPGSAKRIRMLLGVLDWFAAPFGTEDYLFRKYGVAGRDYELRGTDPVLTEIGNSEVCLGEFPTQYLADGPMPIYVPGNRAAVEEIHHHLDEVLPRAQQQLTYGAYSPTQATKGRVLDNRLGDIERDITLGRAKVSDWRAAMADWRRGGGDQMRAEYQEALSSLGRI